MAEKTLLSWEALEFRHYPKNFAWYITLGVIALLIVIAEAVQRDWFGALSLAIIAIFVFVFAMHRPRIIPIRLTTNGIRIDRSYIPYAEMKHFWIVNNEQHKTLNIETTAYLNRTIIVELGNQNPEEVRVILNENVDEHTATDETFVQRIIHKFKF